MKTKLTRVVTACIFSASLALATLRAASRTSAGTNGAGLHRSAAASGINTATTAAATRLAKIAELDARLVVRFDRLAARLNAANAAVVWNDFAWLQSAGYPIGSLEDYADSLESGIVTEGTPSTLLLDYWGTPLLQQSATINALSGEMWTYRRPDGLLVRPFIAGGVVAQVF